MDNFNAFELRIHGLDHLISFAAARWELFAFPEVRDLARPQAKRAVCSRAR
jgi:hypothetical protein